MDCSYVLRTNCHQSWIPWLDIFIITIITPIIIEATPGGHVCGNSFCCIRNLRAYHSHAHSYVQRLASVETIGVSIYPDYSFNLIDQQLFSNPVRPIIAVDIYLTFYAVYEKAAFPHDS